MIPQALFFFFALFVSMIFIAYGIAVTMDALLLFRQTSTLHLIVQFIAGCLCLNVGTVAGYWAIQHLSAFLP